MVISNSDSDDVLDELNEIYSYMAFDCSKSGSGAGKKSLYEQWKDDTHDQDPYA